MFPLTRASHVGVTRFFEFATASRAFQSQSLIPAYKRGPLVYPLLQTPTFVGYPVASIWREPPPFGLQKEEKKRRKKRRKKRQLRASVIRQDQEEATCSAAGPDEAIHLHKPWLLSRFSCEKSFTFWGGQFGKPNLIFNQKVLRSKDPLPKSSQAKIPPKKHIYMSA